MVEEEKKNTIKDRLNKIKGNSNDHNLINIEESQKNSKNMLEEYNINNNNILNKNNFSNIIMESNEDLQDENSLKFNPSLINPNETVSKEKFASFLKEANRTFQHYERSISIYKKKLGTFSIKELKPVNQEIEITLNPSKKQMFYQYVNKKLSEDDLSIEDITRVYNEKMSELFLENERLTTIVNKMSVEVVNKLNEQILELSDQVENEKIEKSKLKTKLDNLDSTFVQIDTLKEELNEKEEEISDLNKQEIKNINKIEELSQEIKDLNDNISKRNEIINDKDKLITTHLNNIDKLKKEIEEKNKLIDNKEVILKEKDENIKTLYTDNINWEEKYNSKVKEMDNYKKWNKWDLDLITSYEKINQLQDENDNIKKEISKLKEDNEKLNAIKTKLSEGIINCKSNYDNTLKKYEESHNKIVNELSIEKRNITEELNKKIQKLQDENENLYSIKLLYDKTKNQLEDFNQVNSKNIQLQKDLNKTIFDYEAKITQIKNDFEENVSKLTMKYENELKEQKENYDSTIEDNTKIYNKDKKLYKKQIEDKDEQIKTLKETIEGWTVTLKKKEDIINNLKELYDKSKIKVEIQNKQIQEYQKNNGGAIQHIDHNNLLSNDDLSTNMDNIDTSLTSDNNSNNEQNNTKVANLSSNYLNKFTNEIIINYLYVLYLYENSLDLNLLINEISNNINLYNSVIFKNGNNTNNSLNCIQAEFLEDLYFTSFDILISKKLTTENDNSAKNSNSYQLSFEDFDKDTINEICDQLIQKNIITRFKNTKTEEQLMNLFIKSYENKYDFKQMNFKEYLNINILPIVTKKIKKCNMILYEMMTSLVESCLYNFKKGKIIINEKVVYNFENYFEVYFNIPNLTIRNDNLTIKKKLTNFQNLDNIIHIFKYYQPKEISIHKLIDMNNIKDQNTLNLVSRLSSSLMVYLNNKITSFEFVESNLNKIIFDILLLPMIIHLNKLVTLDLSQNNLEDNDIEQLIEFIKSNKSIKNFSISGNNLTSKSGFHLGEVMSKNKSIENLDISSNEINENGLTSLLTSLASDNKNLKVLNISFNDLQVDDYKNLCDYLALNPPLTTLDISGNFIDPNSAGTLGVAMTRAKNLKILKISKNGMKDEACANMLNNLGNTSIEHIELDMNKFGENGPMITLAKIKNCKNLKYLSLKQCDLNNKIIEFIGESIKNSYLNCVNLEWNLFDEECFTKFCNLVSANKSIIVKFSKNMVPKNAKDIYENNKNIEFI